MRYKKKPVVIDAWQFTKDNYSSGLPPEFNHPDVVLWSKNSGNTIGGKIQTLEGVLNISENDWIVRGLRGEYYPCKPDIFQATYDPV